MDRILNFTENVLLPAQEGAFGHGTMGTKALLKKIALLFGLTTIGTAAHINAQNKKKKLADNLADAAKESHQIFMNEYLPEINKLRDVISHDIDAVDKKNGIKKYIAVSHIMGNTYNAALVILKQDALYDSEYADESNRDETLKFYKCMVDLKPYISKWKDIALNFSPGFDMSVFISSDEGDYDGEYADMSIILQCKWVDNYNNLKPGLRHLS